ATSFTVMRAYGCRRLRYSAQASDQNRSFNLPTATTVIFMRPPTAPLRQETPRDRKPRQGSGGRAASRTRRGGKGQASCPVSANDHQEVGIEGIHAVVLDGQAHADRLRDLLGGVALAAVVVHHHGVLVVAAAGVARIGRIAQGRNL